MSLLALTLIAAAGAPAAISTAQAVDPDTGRPVASGPVAQSTPYRPAWAIEKQPQNQDMAVYPTAEITNNDETAGPSARSTATPLPTGPLVTPAIPSVLTPPDLEPGGYFGTSHLVAEPITDGPRKKNDLPAILTFAAIAFGVLAALNPTGRRRAIGVGEWLMKNMKQRAALVICLGASLVLIDLMILDDMYSYETLYALHEKGWLTFFGGIVMLVGIYHWIAGPPTEPS